jgi:hypothetical protein
MSGFPNLAAVLIRRLKDSVRFQIRRCLNRGDIADD